MPRRRIRGRLRPLTRTDRVKRAERNERRGRVDVSPSTPRSAHAPAMTRSRVTGAQVETGRAFGLRSLASMLGKRAR